MQGKEEAKLNKFSRTKITNSLVQIYPPSKLSESVLLGTILAIIGGILEAYTFVLRGGVFCNAQTVNIALFGIQASRGEWRKALIYIPPVIAFILGVIVAEAIKETSAIPYIRDSERMVLILETLMLFIIGFIPNTVPNIFITVTISFIASLQVSSFRNLVGSSFATTMITGNLRSASHESYIAITKKDFQAGARAIRYFTIILAFLFGAFLGGLLISRFSEKAIWAAVLLLICTLLLFYIDDLRNKGLKK